jgi:hypothetical protein
MVMKNLQRESESEGRRGGQAKTVFRKVPLIHFKVTSFRFKRGGILI